jgi:hypothetical protein
LTTRSALLRRFTAQIAPSIHDQADLLCSVLAPVIAETAFVNAYLTHVHNKTAVPPILNPQLDFIFHNFTPTTEANPAVPNPTTLGEIINLIQTGHPTEKPTDGAPALLPAPFWELDEVQKRLTDLIAQKTLFICADIARALQVKPEPENHPITVQVLKLMAEVAQSFLDFLPDETAETQDLPTGGADESAESSEEKTVNPE